MGTELARLGVVKIVPGGKRRQDSVYQGLLITDPECDVVLIHDSARPLLTRELARRVARTAYLQGAALAAIPTRDTIKRVDAKGCVLETPDRTALWSAQTPQAFRRRILAQAYATGYGRADATDDAQIAERAGVRVVVVEGDPTNLKVTSPCDLAVAEVLARHPTRRNRRV
jgi:2-C-methyl-D-erythritol 4-phosphate cytidylyltransferase